MDRLTSVSLPVRKDIVLAALRDLGPTIVAHIAAYIESPHKPPYEYTSSMNYQQIRSILMRAERLHLVERDRSSGQEVWSLAIESPDMSAYEADYRGTTS
jgi:hypothetical protein